LVFCFRISGRKAAEKRKQEIPDFLLERSKKFRETLPSVEELLKLDPGTSVEPRTRREKRRERRAFMAEAKKELAAYDEPTSDEELPELRGHF
jgi:hypothetical protein